MHYLTDVKISCRLFSNRASIEFPSNCVYNFLNMVQDFFFILKTLSFSEVDSHYKSTNECICIELHIIDLKKEPSLNRIFSILMKNGGKDSRV